MNNKKELLKIIKKTDIALIITILLFALSFDFYLHNVLSNVYSDSMDKTIVIKHEGEVIKKYPINENIEEKIVIGKNYNTIKIEDGYAKIIDADCSDKICIKHKKINETYESIVCLPNKVVVEVSSDETKEEKERELDSIAN